MRYYFLVIFVLFFSVNAWAGQSTHTQRMFEVVKYRGKIGQYPITMLLMLYPYQLCDTCVTGARIRGFYYYNRVGKLMKMEQYNNQTFVLAAKPIEDFLAYEEPDDNELFIFSNSLLTTVKGVDETITFFSKKQEVSAMWAYKKQERIPITLILDTTMLEWRLLCLNSIWHYPDADYFDIYTESNNTVFPSASALPLVNQNLLKPAQTGIMTPAVVDFVNTSNSRSVQIEQNFGSIKESEGQGLHSINTFTEPIYIADSVITFWTQGLYYANNGTPIDYHFSVMVSSGQNVKIQDVFQEDSIEVVLSVLKKKYKHILREEGKESSDNYWDAPYISDCEKDMSIFLSSGGVYFDFGRICQACRDYDLFLSYREVRRFLNPSIEKIIDSKGL